MAFALHILSYRLNACRSRPAVVTLIMTVGSIGTSSFVFEQHLAKWGGGAAPDYLIEKTTAALDQIATSLKQFQQLG